ncbi:MAG: hypothetical protein KC416_04800 [Myxococcales bacterium]|nr:hypothetical protein [Myxococcales bacterium]
MMMPLKPLVRAGERPEHPAAYLRLAMDAPDARLRAHYAETGLLFPPDPEDRETRLLLLRQLYRAHLDRSDLEGARAAAEEMVVEGALRDIAHHDHARILSALGETRAAIREQRLAALASPEERRPFQYWTLAAMQHFAGDGDGALASLDHAERSARTEGPLLRAHRVFVLLDQQKPAGDVDAVLEALDAHPSGRAYGLFLRGAIEVLRGHRVEGVAALQAFLHRHREASAAQRWTLAAELDRARELLAQYGSPGDVGTDAGA